MEKLKCTLARVAYHLICHHEVVVLAVTVVICAVLVGCGSSVSSETYEESVDSGYFEVIEAGKSGTNGGYSMYYRILVDPETRVMYYETVMSGYERGGTSITPLYNDDGTLKMYHK